MNEVTTYATSKQIAIYGFKQGSNYIWYKHTDTGLAVEKKTRLSMGNAAEQDPDGWIYAYDEHDLKGIFRKMSMANPEQLPQIKYEQRFVFSGRCVVTVSFYFTDLRCTQVHENPAEAHGLLLIESQWHV